MLRMVLNMSNFVSEFLRAIGDENMLRTLEDHEVEVVSFYNGDSGGYLHWFLWERRINKQ